MILSFDSLVNPIFNGFHGDRGGDGGVPPVEKMELHDPTRIDVDMPSSTSVQTNRVAPKALLPFTGLSMRAVVNEHLTSLGTRMNPVKGLKY